MSWNVVILAILTYRNWLTAYVFKNISQLQKVLSKYFINLIYSSPSMRQTDERRVHTDLSQDRGRIRLQLSTRFFWISSWWESMQNKWVLLYLLLLGSNYHISIDLSWVLLLFGYKKVVKASLHIGNFKGNIESGSKTLTQQIRLNLL